MAEKSKAPAFEPDALYRVRLKKPYPMGRRIMSPIHTYHLKGAVVADIAADVILEAKKEG